MHLEHLKAGLERTIVSKVDMHWIEIWLTCVVGVGLGASRDILLCNLFNFYFRVQSTLILQPAPPGLLSLSHNHHSLSLLLRLIVSLP